MKTRNLILILLIFGNATMLASPIQNADFEAVLSTEWTVRNSLPTGVTSAPTAIVNRVPGTRDNGLGAWVLETTVRDDVQDGPQQGGLVSQNFMTALGNAGNGRTYTTRFWVKLDATAVDASVRCLLRWWDNGSQQIPLILAEAVVLQPGVWTMVTGTATLQWGTSLSAAVLEFDVEQLHKGSSLTPPPQWFPNYQIDDLEMEFDGDGDGLWDSEESTDHAQPNLSFSDNPDSDGDRMTDDWERGQLPQLNPRNAADATYDPDSDGFSNVQEYFAATNPHDKKQFPGNPCDQEATFRTRALLRYLALRPYYSQTLVGQMVTDNSTEYDSYVAGLATQTGRWPAMLGVAVEKQAAPLDISASIDHAITFTNAGGIAQVKWAMWNPWRAHLYVPYQKIGVPGDLSKIDILGLLDPAGTPTIAANTAQENLAARAVMIGWIDAVAAEILRYNAATGSQPLLFRPISEMNGGWFWWGHRTRAEYLGLWNLIYDRLVNHHEIHNLIWVYESAVSEHSHPGLSADAAASDYYYPGDDRVDVMSHNLYDEDWVLPFDANKVYARYPKIYAVPQAGPGKAYPARTGAFDNRIYPTQIAARYPRMSFFIVWNSFGGNLDDDNNNQTDWLNDDPDQLTLDDTHQHLAIYDNLYSVELMTTEPRVITRDELAWQPATSPTATAASSTGLAVGWTPALNFAPSPAPTAYLLETSPDNTSGSWSVAQTTSANAINSAINGLTPNSNRWFRVRALYGSDDSLPSDAISATTWSLFQQWKNDTLGDFNAPDNSDTDQDGLVNLLEYGLGADPLSASNSDQPTQSITPANGNNYLSITFRRRTGASGVSYLVESSSDLTTGSWLPDPVQHGLAVDNGDGTETVTFRDIVPMDSAVCRFMRLRVSNP